MMLGVAVLTALFVSWKFMGSDADNANNRLTEVARRSFNIEVNTIGNLDAARSHMISSSIRGDEGKIISLVNDGAFVKEEDVLVKLDPTPFEEKVNQFKGDVEILKSAVDANTQMLEWSKNKVETDIKTAQYNLTIAQLNLKKLVDGDGPHEIAQLSEEVEAARENLNKYVLYLKNLKDLQKDGFEYPSEETLAQNKIKEMEEKFNSTRKKLESYRDHIFPLLKEMADANVEKAEHDLIQLQKGGASEIAKAVSELSAAKSRLNNAQASLTVAEEELKKTIVSAPFSGIVIHYETYRNGENRKPRIGDPVLQNQPILYLPDISSMIVKTYVREVDLYKIALDQKALVKVDAYPDKVYEGKISFIGSLASDLRKLGMGGNYFSVVVSIMGEDNTLRPGMTARISILTDHASNALSIPVQALFEEREKKYCYQAVGGWFKKTPVETGKHNEDYIQILSGLGEKDRVSLVKPDPDKIISVN
jgi:HlyD family secretion protein